MRIGFLMAGAMVMVLAGCGVPRDAGSAAARQAAGLASVGTDDAAVRAALTAQADAWNRMSTTARQKAALGVSVDADFVALIDQTAALALRQRQLIEQGADDPDADRAALEQLRKLWIDVARYLGQ